MFIPNLVGQPFIHQNGGNVSSAATPMTVTPNITAPGAANVINATPDGEFGEQQLHWNATNPIAASSFILIGQQFIVSTPNDGDTVGIELNGSIQMNLNQDALIVPFFARIATAAGAIWGAVTTSGLPTYMPNLTQLNGPSTRLLSAANWQHQVVVRRADGTDPSGTYLNGVQIYNTTAAVMNPTWLTMTASIRQLQDQLDVGYQDTRR